MCRDIPRCYHSKGQHFIDHIITGDETWLHHFVPTSKKAIMEWKYPESPTAKKFKVTSCAGKVMATIFWDSRGVILIEYLERGQTINADRYCAPLTRLCEAIRRKRPGMLNKGVILSNAEIVATVQVGNLESSPPPYSSDLAPSYFFVFPRLKELSSRRFSSDSAVKTSAESWLNGQGPDFYQDGLNKLVLRSDKCLNRFGDSKSDRHVSLVIPFCISYLLSRNISLLNL
ncbi:histone-lysine N-methyltransferase SETMAR [Caerostris extrusa]|uniref:Histone-lysine N-methyltransferase SETMAR n=1 Tax=Caerostris extrusa TaxID=172846 RepID=A0AAV4R458_CAEEX|nr:histone-lysine N-methyltransferase SETMAR [Caerostris extrusa]